VIARAHAKARAKDASLGPLTEIDYLAAVDDFSRIGALRLRDEKGQYLRKTPSGERTTPAFIELEKIFNASRLDTDGALALGKFPSVADERSVTKGEMLALHLASHAEISSARARIISVQGGACPRFCVNG